MSPTNDSQIQGNICTAFGRPLAIYVFFRFKQRGLAARRVLRDTLAPRLTTAQQQEKLKEGWDRDHPDEKIGETVGALGLSAKGYSHLDLEALMPKDSDGFVNGIRSAGTYGSWNRRLETWQAEFREEWHGFLLLCDHSCKRLETTYKKVVEALEPATEALHTEQGSRIPEPGDGPLKNFGFRDDVSKGVPNPRSLFENRLPNSSPAGVAYGCYATFLKVKQNACEFEKRTKELAGLLGFTQQQVAEFCIGRQKDGDPLPGVKRFGGDPDDFVFDSTMNACPYQAHVRVMNQRNAKDVNRILRRGFPYAEKNGDRGILFLSYQKSISDFDVLMSRARQGMDPILSHSTDWVWEQPEAPAAGQWDKSGKLGQQWRDKKGNIVTFAINDVTTILGGEHFFIPPPSFFRLPDKWKPVPLQKTVMPPQISSQERPKRFMFWATENPPTENPLTKNPPTFHYHPDRDWTYNPLDTVRFESPTGAFELDLIPKDPSEALDHRPFPVLRSTEGIDESGKPLHWVERKVDDGLSSERRVEIVAGHSTPGNPEGFISRYYYKISVTMPSGEHATDSRKNGEYQYC